METSGQRIKKRRKEKKLSQVALGKMCDVTHVTVGNWENDAEIKGDNLLKLCRALDTTASWIVYGDSKREKNAELEMFSQKVNEAIQGLDADLYEDVLRYLEHLKGIRNLLKKYEPQDEK